MLKLIKVSHIRYGPKFVFAIIRLEGFQQHLERLVINQ